MAKKIWSKEEIKDLMDKDIKVLLRAIVNIYSLQTEQEKTDEQTEVHNGVGFNGTDAEIMSSFAKQIITYGRLSEKQIALAKKRMPKYAGQLTQIANGELTVKDLIPAGNRLYRKPVETKIESKEETSKVENMKIEDIKNTQEKEFKVVLADGEGGKFLAIDLDDAEKKIKETLPDRWQGAVIREVGTTNQRCLMYLNKIA